ncbi:hypothetical protein [Streptomyces erythrochromogenes]|uniref:hypothetical protein n=1 Tax=Streptomyces erythrochromogenes TaxID=285574 RepID=UPI00386E3940|nr:hypothetical protein OG364_01010 [Streptomyces erythrochromogenes]WST98351.1 hypothetical protein OG364_40525 [Streptomyces erythrochromogenes]
MGILTALASAAFGSTVYLTTLSTVNWLNQMGPKAKAIGQVATGAILCAAIGLITVASKGVVVGFIVGAVLTPPVHRILQRREHVTNS